MVRKQCSAANRLIYNRRFAVVAVDHRNSYLNNNQARGFTLLEVLITLIILAIGVIGIMLVQKSIIDGAVDNSQRSIGVFKTSELLDRIRSNTDGISFYHQQLQQLSDNGCASATRPDCRNTICNAETIAELDAYDVFCGGTNSKGNQFVKLQQISLTCGADPCEMGSRAQIEVTWSQTGLAPDSGQATTNSIAVSAIL